MNAFDAVKYVTGGFTLLAFVVAAAYGVLVLIVNKDANLIGTITGTREEVAARERATQVAIEKYHIETKGMESADLKELALAQLKERRSRLTLIVILAFALSLVGAVVTIVLHSQSGSGLTDNSTTPTPNPSGGTGTRPPIGSLQDAHHSD